MNNLMTLTFWDLHKICLFVSFSLSSMDKQKKWCIISSLICPCTKLGNNLIGFNKKNPLPEHLIWLLQL